MRRALFLDRDGTIIEDRGYLHDPALVRLLPDAAETLRTLARDGWPLVVISNQSGVGRGLITPAQMEAVQAGFLEALRQAGVAIAASYVCRIGRMKTALAAKPSPFLVERAARELGLNLRESWMIGDRQSDIECGKNAGCRTIWLANPAFPVAGGLADFVARNWNEVRGVLANPLS